MRAGLLAAVTLGLVLMSGCTGSETISTGNSLFLVEVPIVNPEARFDVISEMLLSQINIRPNQPDADASLGDRPIGVLATQADLITIDFRQAGSTDPTELVLSSGPYRIDKLQFANVLLAATRPDPLEWDACDEFFAWTLSLIEYSAADLGDLANFEVPNGGAGALTIGIDAAAFIEAFTNTWQCTPPPNPIPLQGTFDEAAFKALAPTYLTIESTSITP